MFIEITKMILAELACRITHWLEQFRNRRVLFMQSFLPRQASLPSRGRFEMDSDP